MHYFSNLFDKLIYMFLTMKANEMHYFSNLFDKLIYMYR
jgi:hypothetical protein